MRRFVENLIRGESSLLDHTPVKKSLHLISKVWEYGSRSHRWLYTSGFLSVTRLPVPVISVGNCTVGGSGKTPMVEFLAKQLQQQGVLILSKGYGNDEDKLLQARCPYATVVVSKHSRGKVAAELFQQDPFRYGVVILDDGMQHFAVHRDIEIMMVNTLQGMTKEFVRNTIPSGILREPWRDAISRANYVVLNHVDLVCKKDLDEIESEVRHLAIDTENEDLQIWYAKMKPRGLVPCHQSAYSYSQQKHSSNHNLKLPGSVSQVHGVCGIACPDTFQSHVFQLFTNGDARKIYFHCFPDHHPFTVEDLNAIKNKYFPNSTFLTGAKDTTEVAIITTEKDFYRCPVTFAKPFEDCSAITTYYLSMNLDVQKYRST